MNIYKVTVPGDVDYDEYIGIVCYAVDEMQARHIPPSPFQKWSVEPMRLIVELVGHGDGEEGTVILDSYKAG